MELDELRRLAAKTELSLNYLAKDEEISKILFLLQGTKNIILKGGTAVNRVYVNNQRFSEDIDFDIITSLSVKQAIQETETIMHALNLYEVEKPTIMNETIRYDVRYTNPLKQRDTIRVEFTVIQHPFQYELKIINFGYVPTKSSLHQVYTIDIILQQKILCFLSRNEAKDFFDIFYLLDTAKVPSTSKDALQKKLTSKHLLLVKQAEILHHFLPRSKRPDWTVFLTELTEKIS